MPESRSYDLFKFLILLGLALAGPLIFAAPNSPQLTGAQDVRLRDEEVREQMIVISRQLGVNCLTCHETNNFASDKKNEFKVAKEHMKLVQVLIDNGMNGHGGSPKADCYMCHRGVLKPDYREPHDPILMGKKPTKGH